MSGTTTPSDGRDDEPDLGGDPACWLARVCPECGRFAEHEAAPSCPACGADTQD